eukprot:gene8360-8544_t
MHHLHDTSQQQRTPHVARLTASVGCPGTGLPVARLGVSADASSILQAGCRTVSRAETDRREALREYRQNKLKLHAALAPKGQGQAAAHDGFKEPQPKTTVFKATAAVRARKQVITAAAAEAAAAPQTSAELKPAASMQHDGVPLSLRRASSASMTSSEVRAEAAAVVSAGGAAADRAQSPSSAVRATMAPLERTNNRANGSLQGGHIAALSSGVPPLEIGRLHDAAGTGLPPPARKEQQQTQSSATKIPHLAGSCSDRGSNMMQQTETGVALQAPLSVARVSSAARVPLPDATPRGFRDAPPSRLPKTPRSSRTSTALCTAGNEDQQAGITDSQGARGGAALEGSGQQDVDARQPPDRHHKAQPQVHSVLGMKQRAAGIVPTLQLSGLLAADRAGSSGLAVGAPLASSSNGPHQPTSSPVSARLSSPAVNRTPRGSRGLASARTADGRGSLPLPIAPTSSRTGSGTAGPRQMLSGVSGGSSSIAAGVQPATLKSPGVLGLLGAGGGRPASSNGSFTARSRAAAAELPKPGEQEKTEESRQQLRLLKVQCMQYRHLNARIQAAMQSRKQKAEATVAAAAAAMIDLSRQLMSLKQAAFAEQWHSELAAVLAKQLPLLTAWARQQAEHASNVTQLQSACSAALSHVPLLNGAAVGPLPEQPDLELLHRQLARGVALMDQAQPALQKLLGPDLAPNAASGIQKSSNGSSSSQQTATGTEQQKQRTGPPLGYSRSSIKTTATLAQQLMGVAAEECSLLMELAKQLSQLSDLHLYANSMKIQLLHMQEHLSPGLLQL